MLILLASLVLSLQSTALQQSVIDLTHAAQRAPSWKILSSQAGGAIGSWPKQESQKPVLVKLLNSETRSNEIYYSIEITNDRDVPVKLPIATDPTPFTNLRQITFRQMLIELGTSLPDEQGFHSDLTIEPVILFGSDSVPNTTRTLAPHEQLVLRLKTSTRSARRRDLLELHVRTSGFDVVLSRAADGYNESKTWVPALSATTL